MKSPVRDFAVERADAQVYDRLHPVGSGDTRKETGNLIGLADVSDCYKCIVETRHDIGPKYFLRPRSVTTCAVSPSLHETVFESKTDLRDCSRDAMAGPQYSRRQPAGVQAVA